MKKYLSIIISLLILTVFTSMNAFAVDNKQYVEFHNQSFKISDLSKETLDWLKWYNSLSDDSKEMVNYVPGELLEKSLLSPKGDIAVLELISSSRTLVTAIAFTFTLSYFAKYHHCAYALR